MLSISDMKESNLGTEQGDSTGQPLLMLMENRLLETSYLSIDDSLSCL